jgi:hypothetical protein
MIAPHGLSEIKKDAALIQRPKGYADGVRLYGPAIMDTSDPRIVRLDITPWYPEGIPFAWALEQRERSVEIHGIVAPRLVEAFEMLRRENALHLIEDWGGVFNHRAKAGNPDELSIHSWAAGPDMNVRRNPRGRPGHQPWFLVWVFQKCGWIWGGEFNDPQHFQFLENY